MKFRPSFESLEGRELLSSVAPLRVESVGSISGYLPSGTVRKSEPENTIMVVTPPIPPKIPTTPPPTQLDLNLVVASPSINSIGGAVHVVITDQNPNWKMARVTIDVPQALKTQLFDSNHGAYTRYHPTSYQPAGGTDYYGVSLTWDETTGMRNVTVTVVYDDPAQTTITKSMAIPVNKPVITSTTLTGNAIHMGERYGTKPGTTYGITVAANNTMGVLFSSVVASTPTSGQFMFVQTLSKMELSTTRIENNVTRHHIEYIPDSGPYLDVAAGSLTPFMNNLWTTIDSPVQTPRTLPTRGDSPGVYTTALTANPDPKNLWVDMSVNFSFDTYLVWKPDGGSYVAVDHISWTYTAAAMYTGSLAPANLYANYTNPTNWQLTSNHSTSWTQTGDKSIKLLEWKDNIQNAKLVEED